MPLLWRYWSCSSARRCRSGDRPGLLAPASGSVTAMGAATVMVTARGWGSGMETAALLGPAWEWAMGPERKSAWAWGLGRAWAWGRAQAWALAQGRAMGRATAGPGCRRRYLRDSSEGHQHIKNDARNPPAP